MRRDLVDVLLDELVGDGIHEGPHRSMGWERVKDQHTAIFFLSNEGTDRCV